MPRFVILEHDHPVLHWDFMLQSKGVLRTWRLPAPPPQQADAALALGEHRLDYLDYEGPVSGDRGTVKRWDAGMYETVAETADCWTLTLTGLRWSGTATLARIVGQRWSIQFIRAGESA